MKNPLDTLRKNRQNSSKLIRSALKPSLRKPSEENAFLWFGGIGAMMFIIAMIPLYILTKNLEQSFEMAKTIALTSSILYGLWPCGLWITSYIHQKKIPDKTLSLKLNTFHPLVCLLTVSFLVLYGLQSVYPAALDDTSLIEEPRHVTSYDPPVRYIDKIDKKNKVHSMASDLENIFAFTEQFHFDSFDSFIHYHIKSHIPFVLEWLLLALLLHIMKVIGLKTLEKQTAGARTLQHESPFRLWLGHSTGTLSRLFHGASLAPHQKVALSLEDASQNILVLGGIGAGKTTGIMHPLLMQLLDQQCGGLIFDIKGDFQKAVLQVAQQTNRPVTVIGTEAHRMSLLEGLTPEVAASFLKSAFLLNGRPHSDTFWVETATELCRNTLGMLSFISASYYNLQGLYRYLFDLDFRTRADEEIDAVLKTLNEKNEKNEKNSENAQNTKNTQNEEKAKWLKAYCHYHEHIFNHFDDKVKAGVHATVAQLLSPFNHPALTETFCSTDETSQAQNTIGKSRRNVTMEEVLNGAVYLIDLPLATWGLGAKVVYSLIKLRFYNVMQQRALLPSSKDKTEKTDKNKPVFFMCDEFQEIVSANKDGLSDLNFWDKSRSSKTIGIISAQAISSFYAAIGDRDMANALLQNFRQKICFKTEDPTTLDYFQRLVDKVDVVRESIGKTRSTQSHSQKGGGSSTSSSSTENTSFIEKHILSAQLFRQLEADKAIALLSINGRSMDDVLKLMPVYLET